MYILYIHVCNYAYVSVCLYKYIFMFIYVSEFPSWYIFMRGQTSSRGTQVKL